MNKINENQGQKNGEKLILRSGNLVEKETLINLRGTKPTSVEIMWCTDKDYSKIIDWDSIKTDRLEVKTWSQVLKVILEELRPVYISLASRVNTASLFIETYEACLLEIIEKRNLKLNTNFVKRLYKESEEDLLITSKVYRSSKNHMIPIITDENGIEWYACAVYTGEIVVVIEALMETIHILAENFSLDKNSFPTYIINYSNRDNIQEDNIDDTLIDKESLARDLMEIEYATLDLCFKVKNLGFKYGIDTTEFLTECLHMSE